MIIRSEQMEAFRKSMTDRFEQRLFAHVQKHFPGKCVELGEEGTRNTIRYGIERASHHGFSSERQVSKYIDLMFGLDPDFDRDPRYPWAGKILEDQTLKDPRVRIDYLCRRARTWMSPGGAASE